MTKKCNKCKKVKNVLKFYKRYDRTNGYKHVCKLCDNKANSLRKKKNGYKYDKIYQVMGSHHHKLSKIVSQKNRDEMSDMYIRSLITKKSKILKPKDISDEFIVIYRENLKLKRLLRKQPT